MPLRSGKAPQSLVHNKLNTTPRPSSLLRITSSHKEESRTCGLKDCNWWADRNVTMYTPHRLADCVSGVLGVADLQANMKACEPGPRLPLELISGQSCASPGLEPALGPSLYEHMLRCLGSLRKVCPFSDPVHQLLHQMPCFQAQPGIRVYKELEPDGLQN